MKNILDEFVCSPECPTCYGEGVVCEDHPTRAWGPMHPEGVGCGCGAAGMPCPAIEAARAVVTSTR